MVKLWPVLFAECRDIEEVYALCRACNLNVESLNQEAFWTYKLESV